MSHRWPIACIAAGVTWMLPTAASAATTPVIIAISGCDSAAVHADLLFEYARAELAPRSTIPSDGTPHDESLHLSVRLCQGSSNGVMLELQVPRAPLMIRQLNLSDVVGDLRARTLAVALAELVVSAPAESHSGQQNSNAASVRSTGYDTSNPRTASAQTDMAPAPLDSTRPLPPVQTQLPLAPAPTPTSVDPVETESLATHHEHSLRVAAGGALRAYFAPSTPLLGPWFSVAVNRLAGEVQFLTTQQGASAGNVRLYDAQLAASYQIISLGSDVTTSANLRAEAGPTWAEGQSNDPSKVQGVRHWRTHIGFAIDLAVATSIARSYGLELHLLGGGNARGLTAQADGQAVVNTQGLFAGVKLGLNYEHFL